MARGSARVAGVALVVAALALTWPSPAFAQGCAMCKRALLSPEGRQMVAAFRSGILVLLAAPFSLVGIIAALIVKMQRRRSAERSSF
jgi:hypothetical protein